MNVEKTDRRTLNWASVIVGIIAVILGVVMAILGQPLIHGNSDAVNIVITVFSILAGFLVAIVTVLGDPTALLPGSHRVITKQRRMIRRQLAKKHGLFYIYLVTLGLIFISKLLSKDDNMQPWLERTYLFLATVGFVLSFRLPVALKNVQERRIELALHERIEAAHGKEEGEETNDS